MTNGQLRVAAPFAVACLGIATFSCMDAVMKGQAITIGAYAALLWRTVLGSVAMAVVFVGAGRRWPAWGAVRVHIARSLLLTGSVLLFFWGLARTPMAEGVALTFLAPLMATFLAAVTLGERVRRGALGGSVLALGGVIAIVAGRAGEAHGPDALAGAGAILLASVLYAGGLVMLRHQAQAADPVEITFLTNIVGLLALLPAAPWLGVVPPAPDLGWLTLAAALAILSSLLLAWAYARGEAQVIAPVEYTAFMWAAVLGALVFGERLTLTTVAGAATIVAGCLIAARGRAVTPVPQTEAAW